MGVVKLGKHFEYFGLFVRMIEANDVEGWSLSFCVKVLILSSNLMLYTMKANEPMIVAIEAKSIIPNIFSPFYFILSYLHS